MEMFYAPQSMLALLYIFVWQRSLDNGYLDNRFLNKYEKNLNKFHTISLLFDTHQGQSIFYIFCNGYNLMVFDGLSNDNKIA
jgi:hypothetical protein